MAIVVDASVIGAIAFGEPEGPTLAAHLEGHTLLAPSLIDYELASIAAKKARRRPEQAPHVLLALRAGVALPIERIAVPASAATMLALTSGLTPYDAAYLWLAQSRDAELATLDATLARAAESRGR